MELAIGVNSQVTFQVLCKNVRLFFDGLAVGVISAVYELFLACWSSLSLFSIKPSNVSKFPLRLVSKSLNLSNEVLNFAAWLLSLFWPLGVFDVDQSARVLVVRARFDLRVLHDAQLVFQFFDCGHEVLDPSSPR